MEGFDWQRIFLGENGSWPFLLEIFFRTVFMYLVLLLFFKITGKKAINQLSVFELIIIVGLGSAAGDPMFYKDVPVFDALVVFAAILGLYIFMNYLSRKKHRFSVWLQGETKCVFGNNKVVLKVLAQEGLGTEDLFSEFRIGSVEQLGQVDRAYLEFTGRFSIYYRPDEKVDYGLPIQPEKLDLCTQHIHTSGIYSCVKCGHTETFDLPAEKPVCRNCGFYKWVGSINTKRIS